MSTFGTFILHQEYAAIAARGDPLNLTFRSNLRRFSYSVKHKVKQKDLYIQFTK